jgi:CRISPR/Cas system-associated exonuclease Cas4 (RecB family)
MNCLRRNLIHIVKKENPIQLCWKTSSTRCRSSMREWMSGETILLELLMKTKKQVLLCQGAVDDIWVKPNGELIVVDYKATAKESKIESLSDSGWEMSYKRQMGVYQWLLRKNGFTVSDTGYFVYANARKDQAESFDDTLFFETTLVPCEGETKWIDETLLKIKATLESEEIPVSGGSCEFCPYREACGKKLLAIHHANKSKK